MKKLIRTAAALFCAALCFALMAAAAPAEDIASGVSGTCSWRITSEGELIISPANGTEGTLEEMRSVSAVPWHEHRVKIKSARFTSKVYAPTFSDYMFQGCVNMKTLDVSVLNTSKVEYMRDMFKDCSSLVSLDLSSWDTSKVYSVGGMFSNCSSLRYLSVSGWDTFNVKYMSGMFLNCSSLTVLDLSDWNTVNALHMGWMFSGCNSIISLNVSGWNTSNVTNMSSMFAGCSSLASIDITDWNTSKVKYMYDMFYGCNSLVSLDLSGWDVKNAEKVSFMFFECSSLNTLDLSNWKLLNAEGTSSMFYGCTSLVSLDLSFWDISNAEAMNYMFADCHSLITLDLSGWDTSKVTDMGSMFEGCKSLTSLDLSGWRTSNVTSMRAMFSGCSLLISLDLSDLDTSKVTNMYGMFSGCDEIRQITFGSAFDCQNKNHLFAPDISMLHVTRGGQDISALGEIRNFRDFSDMSPAELEGTWVRVSAITLGGSGAEDSAVTDIIKVLRYEGMTQKDTNEPTDRGYAPTSVAALPVFGGGSPMSFSYANAAKAAEYLSRLRAERFTAEGHSAAEVSEDADSGDLLLRDGAQTLLRLSLQRRANGSLELAFTSYAPGAVRITLDGREYLVVTPGDVNLDGTMNALDWITIMRWTLVASGGEYTSPNDEGFTIKVNGTDYNLWVLLADMTGTETDNSKNSANWGAAVNAVDWITIMQLTLQAWKK